MDLQIEHGLKSQTELGSNPSHTIYYFHDIEFFFKLLFFFKFENKYAYPHESLWRLSDLKNFKWFEEYIVQYYFDKTYLIY